MAHVCSATQTDICRLEKTNAGSKISQEADTIKKRTMREEMR
jgi:hypothetical protein